MKKLIYIAPVLLFLLISSVSSSQQVLQDKVIELNSYINLIDNYLYEGDKIKITAKTADNKFVKSIIFSRYTDKHYKGVVLNSWKKVNLLEETIEITENNAYYFWIEPGGLAQKSIQITVTRFPGKPENENAPTRYIIEEIEGKSIAVPANSEKLKEYSDNLLRKKGIDPDGLDVILTKTDSAPAVRTVLIDSVFSVNSNNNPFASIWADPFETTYYFKACKGDTIFINIESLHKLTPPNIKIYNALYEEKMPDLYSGNPKIIKDFSFIAGKNFIYTIEFENLNVKKVPVRIKVEKRRNNANSCDTQIFYKKEEKVVGNEITKTHYRNVPILGNENEAATEKLAKINNRNKFTPVTIDGENIKQGGMVIGYFALVSENKTSVATEFKWNIYNINKVIISDVEGSVPDSGMLSNFRIKTFSDGKTNSGIYEKVDKVKFVTYLINNNYL